MKRVMYWLFLGTRGAGTRIRIIKRLRERPSNINQLAEALDKDYKTIKHHMEILKREDIITQANIGYGSVYLLSDEMEASYRHFEEQFLSVKRNTNTHTIRDGA